MSQVTGFGRRIPDEWVHVERYALRRMADPAEVKRQPICLGINWYANFDKPVRDDEGRYWIGKGRLGGLEGGHAICVDNGQLPDRDAWYHFYNQGQLNACVGFSYSRAMTQFYKGLFDPTWLWGEAKRTDGFDDTNPGDNEGTTMDAGAAVLLKQGHITWGHRDSMTPNPKFGVSSYRWALSAQEVLDVLDSSLFETLEAVPLLNSWGDDYPRVVWLPLTTLDRLLDEEGEACVLVRK